MSAEILLVEDWTEHEPPASPIARLMAENRRLKEENDALRRELARLRLVELNARTVAAHCHAGAIDAHGPLACMAMIELGASVGMPVTGRRP